MICSIKLYFYYRCLPQRLLTHRLPKLQNTRTRTIRIDPLLPHDLWHYLLVKETLMWLVPPTTTSSCIPPAVTVESCTHNSISQAKRSQPIG